MATQRIGHMPASSTTAARSLACVALLFLSLSVAAGEDAEDGYPFFESQVRPLLVEHCYECHSQDAGESSGELLVDSAAGLESGGTMGPAIVPGDPERSLLVRAIMYNDTDLQMPPAGKLDDESIEILRRWIAMGADDPRAGETTVNPASPLDRDPQSHWAFVAPKQPDAPESVASNDRDAVDAWARAAATAVSATVNPSADDVTLVRRLYFDLTGLPPTTDQLRDYARSGRPDRYSRLVDRLLASPDFAERFARHWLDVARYADTIGYATAGKERRYEGSERYRDWTIGAFAQDMPYDQMILHQLSGDRTDPNNADGNLDAMGFLTLGRRFLNGLDTRDDRIDVITRGLLGLTVACARCHDHKFDPIPTTDYYSMFGILASSRQPDDGASPLAMVDEDKVGDRPVLVRGQPGNHGPVAPRQFLTALRRDGEPRFSDGSGRWELANRIIAPENPLTARVMVNRLWGHLIGEPLVDSPSDFGFRTSPPAVPEVLDELAVDFSTHWSIKRIVRRIVMTRVYRQSSETNQNKVEVDPDNRLLTRANRKRRDFESMRDSLLFVADRLDHRVGGPPVEITLPTPTPRRTVYAMIDRQNLPSLFRTFDFAGPDTHSPERYFTTVPQQALFLLNSPQMLALVQSTAAMVRRNAEGADAQAAAIFRQVLHRRPDDSELQMATDFLNQPAAAPPLRIDERSLWSYGIAKIEGGKSLHSFEPLEHFTGDQWQASSKFPDDSPRGHAFLGRENGHPPRLEDLGVVRRFTSPIDASVTVRGQMGHRNQGDGVNIGIWIGGKRVWYENQKSNNRPFRGVRGKLRAGETIDLVASPGPTDSFDSFFLRATIQLTGDDGELIETNSVKDFSGPRDVRSDEPLDRLAQLAQVLMMSNEFAFVD